MRTKQKVYPSFAFFVFHRLHSEAQSSNGLTGGSENTNKTALNCYEDIFV